VMGSDRDPAEMGPDSDLAEMGPDREPANEFMPTADTYGSTS